ncbi:FAD/NAD(P)-binding protein [Aliiruegeria sabulilitoris]|uniref:FAD/NAD(P)-binding protein n=1 Tax=Aliiruegeria sabulilitoris TaxID=1510458 RepID=UPI00082A1B45|nr:FAD/NAD(P)-binding protein [Aliiruegeria sabulilitoris]NDR54930.1 Ni/Fe hydrogenase subunit gamma [Pseudoruegeria sp. M32A2M]
MIDPVRIPSALLPRLFRVVENCPELSDVSTLAILPVDGTLDAGRPGQFNMLYAFGVGEIAISISGNPSDNSALLHTIRNVGAVSGALCALREGATLGLRGPFGTPWPLTDQTGRDLLFIAGGLGLAPLRSAILQALAMRSAFRSISLLVGARSPSQILYPAQLADWAGGGALRLSLTVDRAIPGWTGMVGVVTTRLERALEGCDPANVSALVCGPEVMMRHCCLALEDMGVPSSAQWISMERNMKCATGSCGHCQFGPDFVCRDGPVFRWDRIAERLRIREI